MCDRVRYARVVGVAVSATFSLCASAQILPPIPPAPPQQPEYTLPPPPQPVNVKPPEPEVVVPTLVVHDEEGRLHRYHTTLETAAIEAALSSEAFAPEKTAEVRTIMATRLSEHSRWAVENLDKVKDAISSREDLESLRDFDQLARARERANALQQQSLLDRLVQTGAISLLARTRFDRVITEYTDARREEWKAIAGMDVMKIAGLVGRQAVFDQTQDVLSALDTTIDRGGRAIPAAVLALPSLSADQRAALEQINAADFVPAKDETAEQRAARIARVRAFLLGTLSTAQAQDVLRPLIPPPPARP